ncbi:hypothetical protein At15955_51140 (plasmid) [Agrobacterium tumefaciens]|nr:hypothetical protein X971_5142 [Agrobacterium tumefaciens LBA4213 (Ach5)]AKC10716.1 hypothetical protein Ach5_49530 [Agrobacterium tumefaciens]AYM20099.1 hypothetical protein At15955_51140 [Agrobacterium tumefaciens]AYM71402.1 hypothetical protein AtA6_51860 [Agrobacterium tumefaciens]
MKLAVSGRRVRENLERSYNRVLDRSLCITIKMDHVWLGLEAFYSDFDEILAIRN